MSGSSSSLNNRIWLHKLKSIGEGQSPWELPLLSGISREKLPSGRIICAFFPVVVVVIIFTKFGPKPKNWSTLVWYWWLILSKA